MTPKCLIFHFLFLLNYLFYLFYFFQNFLYRWRDLYLIFSTLLSFSFIPNIYLFSAVKLEHKKIKIMKLKSLLKLFNFIGYINLKVFIQAWKINFSIRKIATSKKINTKKIFSINFIIVVPILC